MAARAAAAVKTHYTCSQQLSRQFNIGTELRLDSLPPRTGVPNIIMIFCPPTTHTSEWWCYTIPVVEFVRCEVCWSLNVSTNLKYSSVIQSGKGYRQTGETNTSTCLQPSGVFLSNLWLCSLGKLFSRAFASFQSIVNFPLFQQRMPECDHWSYLRWAT